MVDSYVRRMRSVAVLELLSFAAVGTFWAAQRDRAEDLWAIEEAVLAIGLLRAEQPGNAAIPIDQMETEFVDGAPCPEEDPDFLAPTGPVAQVIADWGATYEFAGWFELSTGERVNFSRPRHEVGAERWEKISDWEVADESHGQVVYQPYDISSPAFPTRTHRLILAERLNRMEAL